MRRLACSWRSLRFGCAGLLMCGAILACESNTEKVVSREANPAAPGRDERKAGRPEFVRGPTSGAPIAPFVHAELERAKGSGAHVLVYVGATWCEPCRRFHDAVSSGRLDDKFPSLRLIEFDADADRDTLQAAGYASRLIPLFAIPAADGRASDLAISGSVKGPNAVESNLVPRLNELLARAPKL